jgi:outer membrane protein assembly factor BamB
MNQCGARFGVASLVRLVLIVGMVVVAWPAVAADKPPAPKPVWSVETKYDLNRLSVGAGGKVVFARDDKKMTSLNVADGSLKYERDLPGFAKNGFWGKGDDTTYVYSTSKELVGIDIETGKDRWHTSLPEGIDADSWENPIAGHPNLKLLAFKTGVTVWDIVQGKVLWSAKDALDGDIDPCVWEDSSIADSGLLLFLPHRTVLVGLGGKELWSAPEPGNKRRGGRDVILHAMESYGRLLVVYTSKQVVLLNNVTGEVIASQTFASDEAAADVEPVIPDSSDGHAPLLVTLGGRLVVADPKEGKLLGRTPENSILGQMAGFAPHGANEYVVMTAVRGNDKTPNVGLHLYRVDLAAGEVKWHAYNGGTIDTRQVMKNVVGEKVSGPYFLEKADGVLLATDENGVRFYNWADGKERWALDENLPNSYTIKLIWGTNSFAAIRSLVQNRIYVSTNPPPVEGEGVIYAAGSDQVFAIDAATGKVTWTSKSKSLSLISGLEVNGGSVIVRQGMYRDANDYGARTVIVTQIGAPTYVEEPEVYIEEDPYGFVGLDAATGKDTWKCLDFDARDPDFTGPMPKDNSICGVATAQGSKDKTPTCKLSKLGVGSILSVHRVSNGTWYLGKDGVAGKTPGACTAAWAVNGGSVKKFETIWDLDEHGVDQKNHGYFHFGEPGYLVTHYNNDVSVVDLEARRVLFTVGKADVVKVLPSAKLLFANDGNKLSMYKLP